MQHGISCVNSAFFQNYRKQRGFGMIVKESSEMEKEKERSHISSCRKCTEGELYFISFKIYFKNILCKRIGILNNLLFTLANAV